MLTQFNVIGAKKVAEEFKRYLQTGKFDNKVIYVEGYRDDILAVLEDQPEETHCILRMEN